MGNDERFRINEYLEKTYGNKKGINSIALVKLTENNKYLFKQKKSVEGDLVVINLNRGFKFKNGHGHFSIMHMKDLEKLDNNEIIYCGCERCIAERDIDSISFLNQEGILSQSKFNGLFNREKYERLDIENTSNVEIIEEEEELPSNLSEEENESGNNIIEPIINDGHGVPQNIL